MAYRNRQQVQQLRNLWTASTPLRKALFMVAFVLVSAVCSCICIFAYIMQAG